MELYGYKAFYKGLKNNYDKEYTNNKHYHVDGEIKFGVGGNGFHFCKRLEDTLRYVDALENDIDICEVKGYGTIVEGEDDYNGYYDMYASSDLKIIKTLTREEIFSYAKTLTDKRLERFISSYKLNKDELNELKKMVIKKEPMLKKYIAYYQENDKDAFSRR